MTYNEILDYCTGEVKNSSASAKSVLSGGINRALTEMRKKLRRFYAIETRTFTFSAGQVTYQTPEDCIKILDLHYIADGIRDEVVRVDDDNEWTRIKQSSYSGGRPLYWRPISNDLYELWPVPDDPTATGEIRMQTIAKPLSQLDYKVGTVQVVANGITVLGTGTNWSASMVGRVFRLADGNGETNYYRIREVISSTQLTLENSFAGASQSNLQYLIGEEPNIPREYHYALADMGITRYYRWQKDKEMADTYYADYLSTRDTIEDDDTDSTSMLIQSKRHRDDHTLNILTRKPQAI